MSNPNPIYDRTKIKPRVLHDFYPTPRVAVEMLLKQVKFEGSVWEPMSGNGAISRVLEEKGFIVRSSDIQLAGYGEGGVDFFSRNEETDNIVTNPAYSVLNETMAHALRVARKKVALLVNIHAVYGVARHAFYAKHPLSKVIVLSRGIPFFKESQWRPAGGAKHAWILFDKEDTSGVTKMEWALNAGKSITDYDRELTKPDAGCVPESSESK